MVLVSVTAGGDAARPTAGGANGRDNAILSVDTSAESVVAMNVTKSTGGRYEFVNSITAIPEKLKEIAAEIKADQKSTEGWYKVVFAADEPPNSVRFAVDRPGTKISCRKGARVTKNATGRFPPGTMRLSRANGLKCATWLNAKPASGAWTIDRTMRPWAFLIISTSCGNGLSVC